MQAREGRDARSRGEATGRELARGGPWCCRERLVDAKVAKKHVVSATLAPAISGLPGTRTPLAALSLHSLMEPDRRIRQRRMDEGSAAQTEDCQMTPTSSPCSCEMQCRRLSSPAFC